MPSAAAEAHHEWGPMVVEPAGKNMGAIPKIPALLEILYKNVKGGIQPPFLSDLIFADQAALDISIVAQSSGACKHLKHTHLH